MSIETEINRISTNVSDTLSAISEMGGEVPDGATSDDMASGVRSIPVGAKIDDTTPSSTTTYSSQKIESELSTLNEAKANNDDLAAVAKSGSYTDLTNKPTIPTVPTTLPNPNALTFTGAVNETYDGSAAKSVAIPTVPESLKNPNKLTFTGAVTAEYDGSAAVSVEIPAGGSGSYTLPIASPTTLGGVKPAAKTDEMTQAVGVDDAGGLWTKEGGGEAYGTPKWTELAKGTIAANETNAGTVTDTGVTWDSLIGYRLVNIGINGNTGKGSEWSVLPPDNNTAAWALLKFSSQGSGMLILKRIMDEYWEAGGFSGKNVNANHYVASNGPFMHDHAPYVRFENIYKLSGPSTIKFYNSSTFTIDAGWTITALSY